MEEKKLKVTLTREPGGTPRAELIRRLILQDYFQDNKLNKFDKYTDTLLYLAEKNEHIKCYHEGIRLFLVMRLFSSVYKSVK